MEKCTGHDTDMTTSSNGTIFRVTDHRSVTFKFVTPTAPSCIDNSSFNYYLYTIEQWALRTWVWCSYVTDHLCGEFTGHRWIPPTKVSDAELRCFLWSWAWTIGCANSRDTGDSRRHHAHYDVTVIIVTLYPTCDCKEHPSAIKNDIGWPTKIIQNRLWPECYQLPIFH